MSDSIEPWMEELLNAGATDDIKTEKQSRIFEAAIEVFAEKGYSGSSTSEIAQRAGVAEGTIFRHYKTKKDLLISIVAPAMVRLIAPFVLREFKDVFKTEYDSPDQFLHAMILNRIEFLEKNKRLLKIMLQELPFHPELQIQFQNVVLSQVAARIQKIVDKFKSQGQIVDMPSRTVMRLTASSLIGYLLFRTFYATREDAVWDDAEERQATVDFIIKGLAP